MPDLRYVAQSLPSGARGRQGERDRRLKGLIVEGEGLVLLALHRILKEGRCEIAGVATNGAEAILTARATRPDFIIIDIDTYKEEGIETIRQIWSERPVPMILLTDCNDSEFIGTAVEAGVSDYVLKPVTSTPMLIAIRQALLDFQESKVRFPDLYRGSDL